MTTAQIVKKPHYTRTRRVAQWKAEQERRIERKHKAEQRRSAERAMLFNPIRGLEQVI